MDDLCLHFSSIDCQQHGKLPLLFQYSCHELMCGVDGDLGESCFEYHCAISFDPSGQRGRFYGSASHMQYAYVLLGFRIFHTSSTGHSRGYKVCHGPE